MCSVKEHLQIQNYPEAVLAASHANNVPCLDPCCLAIYLPVFKIVTRFLYQILYACCFI